ncbi:YciI family protein [Nocardia vinacea]|uniref:YciI family protein n=1 Tax=Nocardia vinacea TaxID=96468 RepID=UPI002E12ACF4|nr:YciI family protein [Nocardia vinacea]
MKYMLLKTYGPAAGCDVPITEWTPEEIKAHIDFQRTLGAELAKTGELVDAQGLAGPDEARLVSSDGRSAPVVTDGPFPETKEFLAGYWLVDVESPERALEIAAQASAGPGPGGKPIGEYIEVRAVMGAPATE